MNNKVKEDLAKELNIDTSILKSTQSLQREDERGSERLSERNEINGLDRDEIRRSLNDAQGPLFVPLYLKNDEFEYYWEIHDTKMPFKFSQAIRLGYTFVTTDEMPGLESLIDRSSASSSYVQENDRIGIKVGDTKTQYLLKIPKVRHKIIQELKSEEADAYIIKQLEEQVHRENSYASGVTLSRAGSRGTIYNNKN